MGKEVIDEGVDASADARWGRLMGAVQDVEKAWAEWIALRRLAEAGGDVSGETLQTARQVSRDSLNVFGDVLEEITGIPIREQARVFLEGKL